MMRAKIRSSVRGTAALCIPLVAGTGAARSEPGDAEITAQELEAHVRWLAADERGGRDTTDPALHEVALYLARALKEAGLEPAFEGDGFLQPVPLARVLHERPPELWVRDGAGAERKVETSD